jgi:hypothetical protein
MAFGRIAPAAGSPSVAASPSTAESNAAAASESVAQWLALFL